MLCSVSAGRSCKEYNFYMQGNGQYHLGGSGNEEIWNFDSQRGFVAVIWWLNFIVYVCMHSTSPPTPPSRHASSRLAILSAELVFHGFEDDFRVCPIKFHVGCSYLSFFLYSFKN